MARVSSAVISAISSTSSGSRVAPRPMLCGNTVAPSSVAVPVHGVDPVQQRDAQPRVGARPAGSGRPCRPRPRACSRVGVDPPPDRMLPSSQVVIGGLVVEHLVALGLRHLPDLLLERHARQQVGHALSHRQARVLVRRAVGGGGVRPAARRVPRGRSPGQCVIRELMLSSSAVDPQVGDRPPLWRGRGLDDAEEARSGRRKVDGGQLALAGAGGDRLVPVRRRPCSCKARSRAGSRRRRRPCRGRPGGPSATAPRSTWTHWPGCWAAPLVQRVVASSSTVLRVRRRARPWRSSASASSSSRPSSSAREAGQVNVASAPPGSV